MNKLTTIIGTTLLAISFNAQAGDCPALSGHYSIGKSGADFSTISEAVKALDCGGVAGEVTFKIENGTYNETLTLTNIKGANAQNPVRFQSKSGDNTSVVIANNKGEATVQLNGTQWVIFENITIDHKSALQGNALKVDGKASHIQFKSVVFEGVENASTLQSATIYFTSVAPKSYMAFEDCEINNGSVGIMKSGADSRNMDHHTTIIGSTFFNQSIAGIMLSNEDAPEISNNVVSSLSNAKNFTGISLNTVMNSMVVSNNIINAKNGTYGIDMNNCVAPVTNYSQVSNNSIAVGGSKTAGIHVSGNTDNVSLNFNRIKLSIEGEQTAQQSYYKNESTGGNINLTNNILYDLNTGGYTIIGNTYNDYFNQLPSQGNPSLSASANGVMIEKVSPIK
jgi:hypothetical protein